MDGGAIRCVWRRYSGRLEAVFKRYATSAKLVFTVYCLPFTVYCLLFTVYRLQLRCKVFSYLEPLTSYLDNYFNFYNDEGND